MIGISRHTDYAMRIVLHLSALPESTQVTADEIARKRLLPRAFMRRIIVRLAEAKILRTVRGAGGGIMLARPASEISMFDVVVAMEREVTLNPCVDHPLSCPLSVSCPVNRAWEGVTKQLQTTLSGIRFDQLANAIEPKSAKAGYTGPPSAGAGRKSAKGGRRGRS